MKFVLVLLLMLSQQAQQTKKPKPPTTPAPTATKGTWSDAEPRGRKTEKDGFEHDTLWEFYTLKGAPVRCGEVVEVADNEDHLRFYILIDGNAFEIYYSDQKSAEDRVQSLCDSQTNPQSLQPPKHPTKPIPPATPQKPQRPHRP